MRLYHYTSASLFDSILVSDLSKGHMSTWNDGIISPVVWLTSDPSGAGHGLTNGAETLSDQNMNYGERVNGVRAKNRFTHDKMKVRLSFDIPDDDMLQLQRFTEYCDLLPDGKAFAKWTGVSCYIDVTTADPKKIKAMMKTQPTKEKTWWISFLPVPARFISAVELHGAKGQYHPYDFESRVRPAIEKLGFFSPSAEALRELQKIVKPLHPLGDAKALVICPKPGLTPTVIIRGDGTDRLYKIETGKGHTGTADAPLLSAWIENYRGELMDAWERATESYFSYYPEQRKSIAA